MKSIFKALSSADPFGYGYPTLWVLPFSTISEHQKPYPISSSLPQEIILQILVIIKSMYMSRANPSLYRRTLHSVCLLSRSWYSVGTEFLYADPVLRTAREVRLFRRTIESSGVLAPSVKNLTLRIAFEAPCVPDTPQAFWCLRKRNDPPATERGCLETIITHLPRVLDLCESLESLSVSLRSTSIPTIEKIQLPNVGPMSTRTRLRELNIFGNSLEGALANFAFPNLEVLSIQNFCFSEPSNLPCLPKLHTLRIHRPMGRAQWDPNSIDSHILQQKFPSLRVFEINKPASFGPCINNRLFSDLRNLEKLVYIETTELRKFDWGDCPALDTVKHLVLGAVGYMEERFLSWCLPHSVEDLTLFVAIEPRFIFEPSMRSVPVRNVLRWIKYNQANSKLGSGSLRRLEINICDCRDGGAVKPCILGEMKSIQDEIQEICHPCDIKVEFNRCSEFQWLVWRIVF